MSESKGRQNVGNDRVARKVSVDRLVEREVCLIVVNRHVLGGDRALEGLLRDAAEEFLHPTKTPGLGRWAHEAFVALLLEVALVLEAFPFFLGEQMTKV